MTKQQVRQLGKIYKQLAKLHEEFSRLSSEAVNKRMPIGMQIVMENAAFGILLADSAIGSVLDIVHVEELQVNEETESSDKEKPQAQRRARMGNRKVLNKPNNRTR
jgi:hypothetical protein